MAARREPSPSTSGPWARRPRVRLGVLGTAGTAARLGQHLDVIGIVPRDAAHDVCREVDAVVLELSAFEQTAGAWAHALRPGGFDRGRSLAALLREAHEVGRPVIALDDLPPGGADEWQHLLGSHLDDVVRLGLAADRWTWWPGAHVATAAMSVGGTAVARRGAGGVTPPTPSSWAARQRDGAVRGHAMVDLSRPWDAVTAVELALLGVAVTDTGGRAVPTGPMVGAPATIGRLLERLGIAAGAPTVHVVVSDRPFDAFETAELDAALGPWHAVGSDHLAERARSRDEDEIVLVPAPDRPVDGPGLAAAATALASLGNAAVAVVASGDAATAVRPAGLSGDDLDAAAVHALALALAPPRRVVAP